VHLPASRTNLPRTTIDDRPGRPLSCIKAAGNGNSLPDHVWEAMNVCMALYILHNLVWR
jgi:hypothetical protein